MMRDPEKQAISIIHDGREVCRIVNGEKVLDYSISNSPTSISIWFNGNLVYKLEKSRVIIDRIEEFISSDTST